MRWAIPFVLIVTAGLLIAILFQALEELSSYGDRGVRLVPQESSTPGGL